VRSPQHRTQGALVLVLTRRANQSIMIGHDVVVTVLEVRGDQVRLGIRAPRSIDVHREEVFLELTKANRLAASPSPAALDGLAALRQKTGQPRGARPAPHPAPPAPGPEEAAGGE
jgi:carbon storage regulator